MSVYGILVRTLLGLAPAPSPAPAAAAPAITTVIPLVAAPAATPAPAPAAPASAADVVDRVQKFYASIQRVSAQFRQAVTNDTFGSTKTSDGSVWIAKPGKMRWDYLEKKPSSERSPEQVVVKKSFISNGTALYVVEHDNKQVLKKNLQQDLMPVAVSFLYGKGDLKAEFNAELDRSGKYGGEADLVLRLTPKQPSAQYKNLFLVVARTDYHVTQSIIVDSSNNVNHFRFFAPDFKKPISDRSFEFNPRSVKSYRVVDADAPLPGSPASQAKPLPPLPAVPKP